MLISYLYPSFCSLGCEKLGFKRFQTRLKRLLFNISPIWQNNIFLSLYFFRIQKEEKIRGEKNFKLFWRKFFFDANFFSTDAVFQKYILQNISFKFKLIFFLKNAFLQLIAYLVLEFWQITFHSKIYFVA